MDSPADPKFVPAVVLLEELDGLLTQLRAMELDLNRAQAAADAKIAALQSQIARLKGERVGDQEEIASLRQRSEVQERALTERQEAVSAVELALHSKIQSLQQDLARSRRDLEERTADLEQTRNQSETGRQELDRRLRAREDEHRAAQAETLETQRRLSGKIHELELQHADKQLVIETGAAEIANLKTEVARLNQRLTEVVRARIESALESTKHPQGVDSAPASGVATNTENAMKIDDVNRPAAGRASEPEESLGSAVKHSLSEEIARLTREAKEKNQILQDRNDELVRVKSELDRLKERDSEIESASSRAESAYSSDAEKMRNEFQAQLALLQAELSQREWALEEQQAEARGREQNLRQEIDALRRQVAEHAAQERHPPEFVFGEPQSNLAQEPSFELADNSAVPGNAVNGFASQRRWNSGFAAKRRWRT